MFYKIFTKMCKKNSLSPTETLKKMGLSTSKLTAWKNGSIPNGTILLLISEFFGITVDYLLTGIETMSLNNNMPDDEQRLLHMYSLLSDMEKGEILGELKAMTKNREHIEKTDNIQTVLVATCSSDNHPPKLATGDFSDILDAPDVSDQY